MTSPWTTTKQFVQWLRRLSPKENFQHQPSILSWKILARLVFTCCRKSTSPVTMDVKSLYTVIPNGDGFLALTQFLNKRPVLQPPTHTLVRLAELVLTLNTFSFNENFYRQTRGVAMGSRLGPNYACLFMRHVEEQIFAQYTGTKPALYKRYIDDIVGPTSGSRDEIEVFATYVNAFHPSLKFTWIISDVQLPFLDLCLKPVSDRLLTSIHYKDTDTHSYLYYASSHPARCKNSIPYSQFLRLRRIYSEDNDFGNKSIEMASFFPKPRLPFQCDSVNARTRVSYSSSRPYFRAFRCT